MPKETGPCNSTSDFFLFFMTLLPNQYGTSKKKYFQLTLYLKSGNITLSMANYPCMVNVIDKKQGCCIRVKWPHSLSTKCRNSHWTKLKTCLCPNNQATVCAILTPPGQVMLKQCWNEVHIPRNTNWFSQPPKHCCRLLFLLFC